MEGKKLEIERDRNRGSERGKGRRVEGRREVCG